MKRINKPATRIVQDTKVILSEYDFCCSCLQRLFAKASGPSRKKLENVTRTPGKKPPAKCYVCRNLMSDLNTYVSKMLDASSNFEFSSFLVGAILKPSILDRDDQIRSKFRLKGIDSIKADITKELGRRFSRKIKTDVDYISPDVTFTVNFKKGSCEVKARPIFLSGRYTKSKRGIPQKQITCKYCRGRGCHSCQFHGILPSDSIEGKIAKFLIKEFGSSKAKMTWIGGEDETSLVLGKGRPFFVKLINPKKRKIKLSKKLLPHGIAINNLKVIEGIPKKAVRFISSVKLRITTEKEIHQLELKKLRKLKKSTISVHENSGKVNKKNVHDIKCKKLSKHSFVLSMKADGGIPFKRFVEGNNVIPNVSTIIRNNSKCKKFDFLDIHVTN